MHSSVDPARDTGQTVLLGFVIIKKNIYYYYYCKYHRHAVIIGVIDVGVINITCDRDVEIVFGRTDLPANDMYRDFAVVRRGYYSTT